MIEIIIPINGWKVQPIVEFGERVGYDGEVNAYKLVFTGGEPGEIYKLDIMNDFGAKDVLNVFNAGGTLSVALDESVTLPVGIYQAQLRTVYGETGDTIRKTNIFRLIVDVAINASTAFPPLTPSEFEQQEAALSGIVAEGQRIVEEGAGAAAEAAAEASRSASSAGASAASASNAATLAAGSAASAQSDAESALASKRSAQGAMEDAIVAKNQSVSAKDEAETSKNQAVSAASSASSAATLALTYAADASASATDAAYSAQAADGSAETALNAKNAAEFAKTGAVEAKNAALTAKADAETAKSAAQSAATDASTYSVAAQTAKTAAEAAQSGAEAAKTGAMSAASSASSAATLAAGSATAAGESEQAAEASAQRAEAAAELVEGKADKVDGAVAGNIASLDTDGNLADSGIPASSIADKTYVDNADDGIKEDLEDIGDATTYLEQEQIPIELEIKEGYYNKTNGIRSNDSSRRTATLSVVAGEEYVLSTFLRPSSICGIVFFSNETIHEDESGNTVLSFEKEGTGTDEYVVDYGFSVPEGAKNMAVQSASTESPVLKRIQGVRKNKSYEKPEEGIPKSDLNNDVKESLNKADLAQPKIDSDLETKDKMVVGAINDINSKISELVTDVPVYNPVSLEYHSDGYFDKTGTFHSDNNRKYAIIDEVTEGDNYKLTTYLSSSLIPAIEYFNNDTFLSYEKVGTGSPEDVVDYEFVIPDGCNKIIVQSASGSKTLSASHKEWQLVVNVYKKNETYSREESDNLFVKKVENFTGYGVKWSISDAEDLGSRCFAATGLSATIGIGDAEGVSDFDDIYPWNEIKRCNIKTNVNGSIIVTYEGEQGFALDGSNGDVFVRIPKFNILRYKDEEYEYRVIGVPGAPVHEAFVENGKILDEIFIGAFEGYIDSNNKLRSIEGVIPTSNETPQTYLTAAEANGGNYSLYDNRCVDAVWSLMAVEFGCRNTNQIIGYGIADFMQPVNDDVLTVSDTVESSNSVRIPLMPNYQKQFMPVGSNITICRNTQRNIIAQRKITARSDGADYTEFVFDGTPIDIVADTDFIGSSAFNTNFCENAPSGAMTTYHTGRANWISGSNMQNPIRYRWIENIVGNLWHYLPDVTFKDLQMYVCKNMEEYQFHKYISPYLPVGGILIENRDNGYKPDETGYNYWITSLLTDTFAKSIPFGKSYDKALISTKAFGGYYYLYDGLMCIANGGGFDHAYRCNMLTQRAWIATDQRWYLYGARMMYKHLS